MLWNICPHSRQIQTLKLFHKQVIKALRGNVRKERSHLYILCLKIYGRIQQYIRFIWRVFRRDLRFKRSKVGRSCSLSGSHIKNIIIKSFNETTHGYCAQEELQFRLKLAFSTGFGHVREWECLLLSQISLRFSQFGFKFSSELALLIENN